MPYSSWRSTGLLALFGMGLMQTASAHGFGRLYNLPVPFWLYGWGAAASLLLSFLLLAALLRPGQNQAAPWRFEFTWPVGSGLIISSLLRFLSVAVLLLVIVTALWGNPDPYRNFSMLAFWIIFLLGLSYITPFVGNVYALLNPWRNLALAVNYCLPSLLRGRLRYPHSLAHWPALALYLSFIAYELFWAGRPLSLAYCLLGYTALTALGVTVFGLRVWFRQFDFFALFYRLLGLMAPVAYAADQLTTELVDKTAAASAKHSHQAKSYLRLPLAGLWQTRAASISTVVFVLAMLSTTAFDGLSMTQWWVRLFWADPTGLVTQLLGVRPMQDRAAALVLYDAWQLFSLLLSPFLYLAAYLSCIALAKWITRSGLSVRQLALDFAYSLLPIAFVYHLTHYASLLLTDGLKILSAVSDPFGWGWNIFGTAWQFRAPILLDMSLLWHLQVGLIVLGHVLSVYVAHRIALQRFATPRMAMLSQLPMLAFMIALTVFGLWILAQPLTVERMV